MATSPSSPKESHQFKFRGTHIPAEIHRLLRDKKITTTEFVLLAVVDSLVDEEEGCWASNSYLASRLNVTDRWIRRSITRLKNIELLKQIGWKKVGENNFRILETAWSKVKPPPELQAPPPPELQFLQSKNTMYSYKERRETVSPEPAKCYLEDAGIWHSGLSRCQRLPRNKGSLLKTNAESFRKLIEVDGFDYRPWFRWYCCLTQEEINKLKLPTVTKVERLRNPEIWSWIMRVWTSVNSKALQEDVLNY